MDTAGSTPSSRPGFVPASPMTRLMAHSGSEISGNNICGSHGWATTSATWQTVRLQLCLQLSLKLRVRECGKMLRHRLSRLVSLAQLPVW
jgi:hypothetical protein